MQSMNLRKKPKVEPIEDEILENEQMNVSTRSHNSSYNSDRVNENDLVKSLCQCLLANVSKRGFVRDPDIGEMFSDRRERELRANVLKKSEKLLMDVLGYRLDRDEEGKRFYLSTNLCKGITMAMEISDETHRGLNEFADEDAFEEESSQTEQFTNCLLEMALMFIFMTKRHISNKTEAEKGVDQMLLKSFLDDLFDAFERRPMSSKQFGELFGPAKSAEFIAHGWLRCDIQRDTVTGSEQVLYHWGPRSETVVSKKRMFESFCDIYGTNPNNFPNHAKVAGLRGK